MLKKSKIFSIAAVAVLAAGTAAAVTSCKKETGILLWGPSEHVDLYYELWDSFVEANPEYKDIPFEVGTNGDAGAYAAMAVDPQSGASIYTFANDQLANLRRIGAIAPVSGANEEWILANHSQFSCDAGKIENTYYGYPVSQDNGYVFCYSKDAFRGTAVWDAERDTLKEGYTFRDLYAALEERGTQAGHEKWGNGLVLWPSGSAWYQAGVFFATGGDYKVEFNTDGSQKSAECWFGYTENGGTKDFTVGREATAAMINSYTNEDGTISKHFMYSEDTIPAYNDIVTQYIGNDEQPLAGIVSWNNAGVFQDGWGEDYACAVLPTLEADSVQLPGSGKKYTWKTFAGCKLMGVNPYSEFARKSEENLVLLHKLAQYLTDYDASMARFNKNGLAPSNLKAIENEKVASSPFVTALAEQMALEDESGNTIGYRVQDSTPTNFWTPIGAFGLQLFNAVESGADIASTIDATLEGLQGDIIAAAN